MKTNVVVEKNIAFDLRAFSYGSESTIRSISFSELKKAKVGDRWECFPESNITRGLHEEQATVVFKNTNGAAVLMESWGNSEDESAKPWTGEPELVWFEFEDEG